MDSEYLLNKSIFLDIISGFYFTDNVFLSEEDHKKFPRTIILQRLIMENAFICLLLSADDVRQTSLTLGITSWIIIKMVSIHSKILFSQSAEKFRKVS